MYRKCCKGLAPSSDAASYSSPGISFRPASISTMIWPTASQTRSINRLGLANEGLASQPCGLMWTTPRAAFRSP